LSTTDKIKQYANVLTTYRKMRNFSITGSFSLHIVPCGEMKLQSKNTGGSENMLELNK
jgi:hypothetical protein